MGFLAFLSLLGLLRNEKKGIDEDLELDLDHRTEQSYPESQESTLSDSSRLDSGIVG